MGTLLITIGVLLWVAGFIALTIIDMRDREAERCEERRAESLREMAMARWSKEGLNE